MAMLVAELIYFAQAMQSISISADIRIWTHLVQVFGLAYAGLLHVVEQQRAFVQVGSLLFFWLFTIFVKLGQLSSVAQASSATFSKAALVLTVVGLAGSFVIFCLSLLVPLRVRRIQLPIDDVAGLTNNSPVESANVFSRLTFSWMTPLMKLGFKKYLTEKDLWNLPRKDLASNVTDEFESTFSSTNGSLGWALFWCHAKPMALAFLFKVLSDLLAFTQPQILKMIIAFVDSYSLHTGDSAVPGYFYAISMFLVSVLQTAALHQYFQIAIEAGMRMRSQLSCVIYRKALVLSSDGRTNKTTGDIVNHMSVDTQRVSETMQFLLLIVSCPFQIVLCFVSLYSLVGWSFLAGLGVMVVMIPLNIVLANAMKKMQKTQMQNKDSRTRLMSEILNNIRSIKLYAWENTFMKRLAAVRNNKEVVMMKKIGMLLSVTNFTWSCAPFMVSCATFIVFVMTSDKPLTTEIIFPALTLFSLLQFPLAALPMVVSSCVEAVVAVGRLSKYLNSEELQPDAVIRKDAVENIGETSVSLQDVTLQWNKALAFGFDATLQDIDFIARKGELACIVGRVGSGKTSFLEGIIGNLHKSSGTITVHGSVAYVAQSAWIMNGTVKENILFGHRYDPHFYNLTLEACALVDDLKILPDQDNTEVGEKGISLSGGQKARLSLARAVYSRSDIYLLDDVLSAVDQHVGRHLIDNVLGPQGLLHSKTRILATNSITVLSRANTITMLQGGRITETGTLQECLAKKSALYSLMQEFGKSVDTGESSGQTSRDEVMLETEEDVADLPNVDSTIHQRKFSTVTLRRPSMASFTKPHGRVTDDETEPGSRKAEDAQQGKVKFEVYLEYAKASSWAWFSVYLVLLILSQIGSVAGSFWLKHWAEVNTKKNTNPDAGAYIGIYFALGVISSFFTVTSTLVLWIFCAIRAARILHDNMAEAVFHSPMSFFETTPIGRIMNRFSSDVFKVDEVLVRVISMFFRNGFQVIFVLIVISTGTPIFLVLIIPLTALYMYIQQYYLRTSRELKRLDSTTRSPIFAHFQESLGGISTIRAYGQGSRFTLENEWRVDTNQKAWFLYVSTNRWLAVRLEFIGSIIILASAYLGVMQCVNGSLSPGFLGLILSFSTQVTQSLNWVVRQTVDVETNIVSVERMLEYTRLPREAPEVIEGHRPPEHWPSSGRLELEHYSTRYRPGLPLILKDISMSIKASEKIGIVGRTGAGKSSLTLALFRIIEAAGGKIVLDNVDIASIGLHDLRSNLAIIPQDSQAFEGTIRENLDPEELYSDEKIWQTLQQIHLADFVSANPDKLNAKVQEGGSNLSTGQKQLMCIGRALLRPSHVLVLDEATAAVDVETDKLLQETIRKEFKDRTILTIAHRINTIMDADRILVLSDGHIAEFDTPDALIQRGPSSMFHSLVAEAGLLKDSSPAASSP